MTHYYKQIRNLDTMKKQICYLLAMFFFLSVGKASADPFAGGIDANVGGNDAGAFNKMEQSQVNNYQLEKSYIHSFDWFEN